MKFGNKIISFEDLIDKTISFINRHNLNINEFPKEFSSLCADLFGSSNYNDTLHFKTVWDRNQNGFASAITSAINSPSLTTIEIELNGNEYLEIQKFISNGKRKRFLAEFDFFLNDRLKSNLDFKLNCFLKSKYNWFVNSKFNLTKQAKIIWRGKLRVFKKK